MTGNQYTVILVHSTSHAIRAEKVLCRAGISCKLIPVPRRLSSDCGVCIRIARADTAAARESLQAANVEIDEIHDLE
ncbi:MAG: DUF3343 domain-containing protein [Chloroflexi bacterium]|nr:DUF3343 domain-containing protein [Chloroflexota bacterium]